MRVDKSSHMIWQAAVSSCDSETADWNDVDDMACIIYVLLSPPLKLPLFRLLVSLWSLPRRTINESPNDGEPWPPVVESLPPPPKFESTEPRAPIPVPPYDGPVPRANQQLSATSWNEL